MHHQRTPRAAQSAEHHALGRAVRETRTRREISQEVLAHRSTLHRNYIGAVERGESNPTFSTLLRLTGGLDVVLSELVLLYERNIAETGR